MKKRELMQLQMKGGNHEEVRFELPDMKKSSHLMTYSWSLFFAFPILEDSKKLALALQLTLDKWSSAHLSLAMPFLMTE